MFYYWLHIIYIFICSKLFWDKVDATSTISRTRRVSILDCDSLRFMANSRYLYYMDLIRFEITFRSKLYENTIKKSMFGVLGSQKIIYKKPLKRWSQFKITLVLEGWDDKWVYHSQIFEQNNEICAVGYTKAAFWKNKKVQDIKKILSDSGVQESERKVPEAIQNIFKDDYNLLKIDLI
ncbi:acyl-CoA thioesterase [uncultured Algibacter sp.]|uniref:acyl-CoA thioesterase n=1 Tax=uncultured Algibacter sp. TaxID=298659 RepID=UPI0030ED62E4